MKLFKITIGISVLLCISASSVKHYGGFGKDAYLSFSNVIPQTFEKADYINWIQKVKIFGTVGTDYSWIRNDENLLTVHNTLKKIGYKNVIESSNYYDLVFDRRTESDFFNLTFNQIVDSLIISYELEQTNSYFSKFWDRRLNENTDSTCHLILSEIKSIYSNIEPLQRFDSTLVNDTIEKLVSFDIYIQDNYDNITKEYVSEFYDYLKSIGLYQSAYNLWFLREPIASLEFDKNFIQDDLNVKGKKEIINGYPYYLTKHSSSWIWHFDRIDDIDRRIIK